MAPPPGPLRLYLVEDSQILTQLLSRLLGSEAELALTGHAATARAAIEGIARDKPDVVVLDLHLAQGSGYDVLRELGHDASRPQFIVLTNHTGPEHRTAATQAGASHFFDKSREIPALLALLRRLAADPGARRARDEAP